jgi:hypothetical protein
MRHFFLLIYVVSFILCILFYHAEWLRLIAFGSLLLTIAGGRKPLKPSRYKGQH